MTDIKTSVQTSKFSYRIEPQPEGGFLATPSDPGMPAIAGTTREEVQHKIEAAIADVIGRRLPATFKLGNLSVRLNSNLNVTTRTQSSAPAGTDAFSNSPAQSPMLPNAAPIVPEPGSSAVLWVLAGLTVLAALIYYSYLHL